MDDSNLQNNTNYFQTPSLIVILKKGLYWSTQILCDAIVTLSKRALLLHSFLLFDDEFEKRAWRNFIKELVVFHLWI